MYLIMTDKLAGDTMATCGRKTRGQDIDRLASVLPAKTDKTSGQIVF